MLNGRIDVNYRLVACTPPTALQVKVDGNDGPGLWLRLLITVSLPSAVCLWLQSAELPGNCARILPLARLIYCVATSVCLICSC